MGEKKECSVGHENELFWGCFCRPIRADTQVELNKQTSHVKAYFAGRGAFIAERQLRKNRAETK